MFKTLQPIAWLAAALLLIVSCQQKEAVSTKPHSVETLKYNVIAIYPHRPQAFTQGLILDQNVLYESTGLYGHSSVAKIEFPSGKVLSETKLASNLFGEGLTKINDQLVQLTWQSGEVFRYDSETLALEATQSIEGEGWGLTAHGDELVSSDGSATLTFRNAESLAPLRKLEVNFAGRPLKKINEMESAYGLILANVFQSPNIVFIDPQSGQVLARIDLSSIVQREIQTQQPSERVANGIAFRSETDTLLITGKRWQAIYEIKLEDNEIEALLARTNSRS